VTRVRFDGDVTLRGRDLSADPLRELLGPHAYSHRVLLDLQAARGIDSSGVSWLMRVHNGFRAAKGRLVLHQVPPTVLQLLEMLRLTPLLYVAATEDEARDLVFEELDPPVRPQDRQRPPRAG
jgi:anti-anti-sigma factor